MQLPISLTKNLSPAELAGLSNLLSVNHQSIVISHH
jgi:hypothetical protein